MAKWIDADALKDWGERVPLTDDGGIDINDFEEYLDSAPAADVVPVRHGEWVKMSDADGHYFCCSKCGEELYRKVVFNREFDLFPTKKSIDKTNFCPNCGAKMDKEAGNDKG